MELPFNADKRRHREILSTGFARKVFFTTICFCRAESKPDQGLFLATFRASPFQLNTLLNCWDAQVTIHEAILFASFLINGDSPEINVWRQTVPEVERMRIVRFVTQFVVARRQSDYHINFPVLTRTTCMCRLGLLHLPHA